MNDEWRYPTTGYEDRTRRDKKGGRNLCAKHFHCPILKQPPSTHHHPLRRVTTADSTLRRINCTEYKYLISLIPSSLRRRRHRRRTFPSPCCRRVKVKAKLNDIHLQYCCCWRGWWCSFIFILSKRSSKHTNYSLSNFRHTNRSPGIIMRRGEYIKPVGSPQLNGMDENKSVVVVLMIKN